MVVINDLSIKIDPISKAICVTEGTVDVEGTGLFVFMFGAVGAIGSADAILKPYHKFYVRKWVYLLISEKSYSDILAYCVKGLLIVVFYVSTSTA
jgi:hypothetical protein